MFKNKLFKITFITETILPWIVPVFGIFAFFYFNDESKYYRMGLQEEYE